MKKLKKIAIILLVFVFTMSQLDFGFLGTNKAEAAWLNFSDKKSPPPPRSRAINRDPKVTVSGGVNFGEELDKILVEHEKIRMELDEKNKAIAELDKTQAEQAKTRAELNAKNKTIGELQQRIKTMQGSKETARGKVVDISKERKVYLGKIEKLEKQIAELKDKGKRGDSRELVVARKRLKVVESDLEKKDRELLGAQTVLDEKEAIITELSHELNVKVEDQRRLLTRNNDLESKIAILEKQALQMRDVVAEAKTQLNRMDSEKRALENKIDKLRTDIKMLEERKSQEVVQTEMTLGKLREKQGFVETQMKGMLEERATLLAEKNTLQSKISSYEAQINRVKDQIDQSQKTINGLRKDIKEKDSEVAKIRKVTNDEINKARAEEKKAAKSILAENKSLEKDFNDIELDMRDMEEELLEKDEIIEQLKKERKGLVDDIENAAKTARELESKLSDLKNERGAFDNEKTGLQKALARSNEESRELSAKLEETERTLGATEGTIADKDSTINALMLKLEKKENALKSLLQEKDSLQEDLEKTIVENNALKKKT